MNSSLLISSFLGLRIKKIPGPRSHRFRNWRAELRVAEGSELARKILYLSLDGIYIENLPQGGPEKNRVSLPIVVCRERYISYPFVEPGVVLCKVFAFD